jgi:Uma2 family endonuclease
MDADAFLQWCLGQEGRYEFVNGEIVAMAGATERHDRVVGNLFVALAVRLRAKPCRPHTGDLAVRTSHDKIRRPDVSVDCEPGRDAAIEAERPTAVFEVLSPSTRQTDLVLKLDEYRQIRDLRHIVLIEQMAPDIVVYSREEAGGAWVATPLHGLDAMMELAAIGVSLPLSELYADVEFEPEIAPPPVQRP